MTPVLKALTQCKLMSANQGRSITSLAKDITDIKSDVQQILGMLTAHVKTEEPPVIDLPLSTLNQVEELDTALRNSERHQEALVRVIRYRLVLNLMIQVAT